MGQFQKGNDPRRNTAGRPKGSVDKINSRLTSMIFDFVCEHWSDIETDWAQMKPGEKGRFMDGLIRLIKPPPLNPERLTEEQLEQIVEYLKQQNNEKAT